MIIILKSGIDYHFESGPVILSQSNQLILNEAPEMSLVEMMLCQQLEFQKQMIHFLQKGKYWKV